MTHTVTAQPDAARRGLPIAVALAAVVVALVALWNPLVALVLSGAMLLVAVALLHPDLASYAVLFLLYSNLGAVAASFHGVPKFVSAAFPVLLLLPLVRDLFVRKQKPVLNSVTVLLVLLLGVQAVAMCMSRDPRRSLGDVVTFLVEGLALYVLVLNVVRDRRGLKLATWSLLAAGVLMSVVPLFQQFTGTFDRNYGGLAQVDGLGFRTGEQAAEGGSLVRQPRLAGPIGEKNRYAQVMLVLIPLGLVCSWNESRRATRLLALACTGLISLGFILAFSRGGAFGLVCMFAVMVVMRIVDVRRFLWIAVGVVLLLAAMPQYWTRLATVTESASLVQDGASESPDGAVRRRITEMMAAARVFLDHPVLGVGPGLFKSYAVEYGKEDALRRIEGERRAHNLILEIAAETGVFGLALFLGAASITLLGLASTRRQLLTLDPELANLLTAYMLALLAYLASGVFLHLAYMRYYYVVLALGGAGVIIAQERLRALRPGKTQVVTA